MDLEQWIQYITIGLAAAGVLAFLVNVITQVVREMPVLGRIPEKAVSLTVSIVVCILSVVILCTWLEKPVLWYYITAAVAASFVVYMVATGGWKKLKDVWDKTRYRKK